MTYTRRTNEPDLIFAPEGSEDLFTWTSLVDAVEISDADGQTETVVGTDPIQLTQNRKAFCGCA